MNKKTANALKAAKQPTEEQLQAEKARALRQKLMSMAEGCYFSLASNPAYADKAPHELVKRTMDLAEEWMSTFYGLVRKPKEEETKGQRDNVVTMSPKTE